MNKITVTVGSVTYAIKLRRLLQKSGINARQVKVDNTKNESGCRHGVEISEADLYPAIIIMKNNDIEYSIYHERK